MVIEYIITNERAEKILHPSFARKWIFSTPFSEDYNTNYLTQPDLKKLEKDWNLANKNKQSKKETSSKSDNLTGKLKELNKLYKDGALSKKEFTKAKNKLLK